LARPAAAVTVVSKEGAKMAFEELKAKQYEEGDYPQPGRSGEEVWEPRPYVLVIGRRR
jgi:hypothetical protein